MRERAMICLLLQAMVTCCAISARLSWRPREVTPAFAEESWVFEVEVNPTTPEPTAALTVAPEPTAVQPVATPSPEGADVSFRVEVIRETTAPTELPGKRILIYHTHTWEAYEQVGHAPYVETEKWRTKDDACNVVAVGEALAAQLRALGFDVVHDRTAFEPPNLDDAYARSLTMLEQRSAAGEAYDLYIDLHRDAVASSSTIRRTVHIGGTEVARFMVLVGKGTTGGYAEKPDWEANYALAERITDGLNRQCDGLAREIKLKTGRFNQHVSDCCVLIECGVNTNTLEQVLAGVPYLAQAVADALTE